MPCVNMRCLSAVREGTYWAMHTMQCSSCQVESLNPQLWTWSTMLTCKGSRACAMNDCIEMRLNVERHAEMVLSGPLQLLIHQPFKAGHVQKSHRQKRQRTSAVATYVNALSRVRWLMGALRFATGERQFSLIRDM